MTLVDNHTLAEPWWLLLLVAVVALMFFGAKVGARSWIAFPTLRVLSTLGWKPKQVPFRPAWLLLPLFLIPAIIGMSRPQELKSRTTRTASGIDILVALDVSYSMSTRDFVDPNGRMNRNEQRIDAAKIIINDFIKKRPDDRIGIVIFAARPYTVSPITLDHQILRKTLKSVELISNDEEGGTAIGSAIIAAGERLERIKNDDGESSTDSPKQKSKVIVLVTDGASNSGQLSPVQAAEIVADLKIKIYPVAIGTEEGRIPGMAQTVGQEFDTETLEEIAEITQGDYYRARDYTGLREAFKSIDALEKTEVKRKTLTTRRELYPWFVGVSVFLVIGYVFVFALNPLPMP